MNNEQHTEILSRNRLSHNTIVVAIVPVLAISIVFIVAVLPHLAEIWLMIEALAFTLTLCLIAVLVIAVIYIAHKFRIHAKQLDRQARFFTWSEGAAWINDKGELVHLSATHEQAKLPAPRVTVTEEIELSEQDRIDVERSKVLALRQQGLGLHAIEKALNVPYNKVRDYCNTMDELQKKAAQRNQAQA